MNTMKIPGCTAERSLNESSEYQQTVVTLKKMLISPNNLIVPQLRRECTPRCICWPDGCLCFWDCTV